jgi:hypothetical protein
VRVINKGKSFDTSFCLACQKSPEKTSSTNLEIEMFHPGDKIGPHKLVGAIGRGGFSDVVGRKQYVASKY